MPIAATAHQNVKKILANLTIVDGISESDSAADNSSALTTVTIVTCAVFAFAESPLVPPTLDIVHDEVPLYHRDGGHDAGGLDEENRKMIVIIDDIMLVRVT